MRLQQRRRYEKMPLESMPGVHCKELPCIRTDTDRHETIVGLVMIPVVKRFRVISSRRVLPLDTPRCDEKGNAQHKRQKVIWSRQPGGSTRACPLRMKYHDPN